MARRAFRVGNARNAARHVVGVKESNWHFAAGLAGLGVIQTFARERLDAPHPLA
jgi:hypothetical protein